MLLKNATLVTMQPGAKDRLVPDGAVVLEGERIRWAGPLDALPSEHHQLDDIDLAGRLVTPALIDCHTHLVYGGDRAGEFEARLNGASYQQIARAGGGILSTVTETRRASAEQLLTDALTRVDAMIAQGVGTIEVKSGYGLDQETELKMLRVARRIETQRPVTIKTSFLGAHAVPPEFAGKPDAYIDTVCLPTLRAATAEGLVDAVDGFCEDIAFDRDQIARVMQCAADLGLPVKLHAEQLGHGGGAALAARFGALSADHLEYAAEADAAQMAAAGTVAVLLPGAFYTLGETQAPPVDAFRSHGVAMALATDCNPGSSPLASLLLAMNMGCTLLRMTPQEALEGVTRHAARALGLSDRGQIRPGYRADLAVWDAAHPAELSYRIGWNPLYKRIFGGAL